MTNTQILLSLIGLLISISGWVTFLYNHFTYQPKIVGRIYSTIIGNFVADGQSYTSYLVYFYLSNKGKNPVRIHDIELEVKINDEYTRLKRVYGIELSAPLNFTNEGGQQMGINNLSDNLLYNKKDAITYGETLEGFALFCGDPDQYTQFKQAYRSNIIDVFNNSHIITTFPENFGSVQRLEELTGMKLI